MIIYLDPESDRAKELLARIEKTRQEIDDRLKKIGAKSSAGVIMDDDSIGGLDEDDF